MNKLALITGSSGFIGTNLVSKLLREGWAVIGVDNFSSSEKWKSEIFADNKRYEFMEGDICGSLEEILEKSKLLREYKGINRIYNLACPASPPRYQELSLETIDVNTVGMKNVLDVARKYKSKILHSSTSEVYGDPLVHPQPEQYRGNVNTIGPRSCYDEGKRISETICYEYKRLYDVDVKLVRIFNTYGSYMDPSDGRVVTNFIRQALKGEDITIYGDGKQTRSFQYVSDLLLGFEKFMQQDSDCFGPINLGNPHEFTILELTELVLSMIESKSKIIHLELPKDDPKVRKPDITRAIAQLEWKPVVPLREGLEQTIQYYRDHLQLQ